MNKETIDNLVKTLKENSVEFKLDTYINKGKGFIRGIFIYKPDDEDTIKRVLNKNILVNFKIKKSYSWYLGDRMKTLVLKPIYELEMEIPEIGDYQVNNYV